jgi:F0F1-type ATP synthase assembly protein I
MAEKSPFRKLARGFAVASALGTGLAAAAGLGVYLGYRLDEALGSRPICMIVLGLLGGGAGLAFVLRSLAALERGERGSNGEGRPPRAPE